MTISPKIEKWITDWITSMDVSKISKDAYENSIHVFWKWFFSNKHRKELLPETKHIVLFKNVMKRRKRSEFSIDLYISSLKKFFKWTLKKGHMSYNPMDEIRNERKKKEYSRKPLSREQCRILLKSVDQTTFTGLRDYTMILLMLNLGLRRSEITRLNIDDMQDQRLKIQGKGQRSKNEWLPVSDMVMDILSQYMYTRRKVTRTSPMFVSWSDRNRGERLSPSYVSTTVKNYLKKVDIISNQITCHSLRHTCAVQLLSECDDIHMVQTLLRHSSIDVTRRYTYTTEKELIRLKNQKFGDKILTDILR